MRGLALAGILFTMASPTSAQETVAERVTRGCATEIETYCSQVTQGEGRLLACFFAHEDKLGTQCVNALYDGMMELERAVEALSYVATMCRDDIDGTCGDLLPGEGRIAQCLLDNKDTLEPACQQALDDVELEVEG